MHSFCSLYCACALDWNQQQPLFWRSGCSARYLLMLLECLISLCGRRYVVNARWALSFYYFPFLFTRFVLFNRVAPLGSGTGCSRHRPIMWHLLMVTKRNTSLIGARCHDELSNFHYEDELRICEDRDYYYLLSCYKLYSSNRHLIDILTIHRNRDCYCLVAQGAPCSIVVNSITL